MASDMQKVSCNLLQNNSFEEEGFWSGGSYSTDEAYEGNHSYCLTGSESGDTTAVQHLILNKGDTYVLSAYVKNEEGAKDSSTAGLSMEYESASGAVVSSPISTIDKGNGWQRVSVSITLSADAATRNVDLILHKRGTGSAYFDCIQVEEGTVPNRFNLMEDPDFYHFDENTPPWHWDISNGAGMS
nr:carbohydrate binding domain-containing protein [uncultured Solibaculum sp.]